MVNAQYNLLDHFGIDKLFSVAGGHLLQKIIYQSQNDLVDYTER